MADENEKKCINPMVAAVFGGIATIVGGVVLKRTTGKNLVDVTDSMCTKAQNKLKNMTKKKTESEDASHSNTNTSTVERETLN